MEPAPERPAPQSLSCPDTSEEPSPKSPDEVGVPDERANPPHTDDERELEEVSSGGTSGDDSGNEANCDSAKGGSTGGGSSSFSLTTGSAENEATEDEGASTARDFALLELIMHQEPPKDYLATVRNLDERNDDDQLSPVGKFAKAVVSVGIPIAQRAFDAIVPLVLSDFDAWVQKRFRAFEGHIAAKFFSKQKVSEKAITFDDVIGCDEAKQEIRQVVDFLVKGDKYRRLGAEPPRGILLVGPPGTGKTLMARAAAAEAGVPFFSAVGSDFNHIFAGMGVQHVKRLFAKGRSAKRAIIFIDELDYVGRRRGDSSGRSLELDRESTLTQLLAEMDGFTRGEAVVVIATTNRQDILDPALLRSGRFGDLIINFEAPDVRAREQLFLKHFKTMLLAVGGPRPSDSAPAELASTGGAAVMVAAPADAVGVEVPSGWDVATAAEEDAATDGILSSGVAVVATEAAAMGVADDTEAAPLVYSPAIPAKASSIPAAMMAAAPATAVAATATAAAAVATAVAGAAAMAAAVPAGETSAASASPPLLVGLFRRRSRQLATAAAATSETPAIPQPLLPATPAHLPSTAQQPPPLPPPPPPPPSESDDALRTLALTLARLTPGCVGADIATICNKAVLLAAAADATAVTLEHLSAAVDRVASGLERRSVTVTKEDLYATAVHEAGHAVAGWLLPHADNVTKVSIVWRGSSLGFTQFLPKERVAATKAYFLDQVCMGLAGRAAEEVLLGTASTGAVSDLHEATRTVRAMVSRYGFGSAVGFLYVQPDAGSALAVGPETATRLDREVQRVLRCEYRRALRLVRRERRRIEALVELLLEKETVLQADVERIFGPKAVPAAGLSAVSRRRKLGQCGGPVGAAEAAADAATNAAAAAAEWLERRWGSLKEATAGVVGASVPLLAEDTQPVAAAATVVAATIAAVAATAVVPVAASGALVAPALLWGLERWSAVKKCGADAGQQHRLK